jgi:uncharacterized membrane protein YagU involved in acid resistance
MDFRVRLGLLAGLAAGAVKLVVDLGASALHLTVLDHLTLGAAVFVPRAVAGGAAVSRMVGLVGALTLSALFGLLFAVLAGTPARRHYVLFGLVFGVVLYVVNLGLIGPALGIMRPIWTYGPLTMASHLVTNLVYGGTLGALMTANTPARAPA